jgi:beta-N-acetylhexosaminidase
MSAVAGVRRRRGNTALAIVVLALAACQTLGPSHTGRLRALEPNLGQLLVVGFTGTAGDGQAEPERLICDVRVGGILIFGRNVVTPGQLARLNAWMSARAQACTGGPLLVAVDAEGGRVMRLSPRAGFPPSLSPQDLGTADDLGFTEQEARRMGAMLREAGINWNLAPVVDVAINPANPVIVGNGRSFGADPERVAAHARAFIRGMHAEGLLTAVKHFPGHGSSFTDSHLGFVDVSDTANLEVELVPYRQLLAADAVDSVMTAHVFNRNLDPRYPATLSGATIEGLLRRQLGFGGVVVSDDLRMRAIEQQYGIEEAAVLALNAGVDILVIGDDRLPDGRSAASLAREAIRRALWQGRLDADRVESALARVAGFKARLSVSPRPPA